MDSSINKKTPRPNILIVDDEPYVCVTISRWLEPEGYKCRIAYSVDDALQLMEEEPCELLISDINMPGKTGLDLLREVRKSYPNTAVLMATAVDSRDVAISALELGAYGYMIKPFDKNEFIINVVNALERYRLTQESREYEQRLEREVRERTTEIRKREEEIALRLVWASEYRDDETGEHIRRIGLFAAELAKASGWSPRDVDDIRVAAPMHDVGKIGIADSILLKPGRLTPEEFEVIKTHTTIGARMLGDSEISLLQLACSIALHHHERWDGHGYPHGLKGEQIPLAARIVSIVDVYDALVYDRVYHPAFSEEKALQIIKSGKGTQFDPELYENFMKCHGEFLKIREKYK
jgi:putative two-component system response regulator